MPALAFRQRRARGMLSPPRAVDHGNYIDPTNHETQVLRNQERTNETYNAVADYCTYLILSEASLASNALKVRLYQGAVERFADRLPAAIVRKLVDATIRQEEGRRAEIAEYRRRLARQKADKVKARAPNLGGLGLGGTNSS